MNKLPELGPILDEDVSLLQAVIRMTCPKVLVEFGHFYGKSAKAMLEVMDSEAHLYSYDPTKYAAVVDPRFTFIRKSQDEFEPLPSVDFVFLDASHELSLNKKTFQQLLPCLSPTAIIAIHDTGTWPSNVWNRIEGYQMGDEYVFNPEEREFVNWLKENNPEFEQIHFHTTRQVRHGITIIQRYNKLKTL